MSLFNVSTFDYNCEALGSPVPPDLLLELCHNGKVDIMDIFISDITEQYIAYVSAMEKMDYENISNFLIFASKLLEFKSNALLPKVEFTEAPEDILPEDLFLMRLTEYSILKDAAEKLSGSEILHRFYREPMFAEDDYKLIIKNFSIEKMVGAFSMLMEKVEQEEDKAVPKIIQRERFSVADRILQLIEEIRALKVVTFFGLFEPDYTKTEVLNTFLALLEMLKQQIITVEQAEKNGDITIRYSALTDTFDKEKQEELLTDVKEYN